MQPGVPPSVRRPFAKMRVDECNRDVSQLLNPERGKAKLSGFLLVDAFKNQFGRPGNASD